MEYSNNHETTCNKQYYNEASSNSHSLNSLKNCCKCYLENTNCFDYNPNDCQNYLNKKFHTNTTFTKCCSTENSRNNTNDEKSTSHTIYHIYYPSAKNDHLSS